MSPRSEQVNQQRREESKERILAAALRVFAERGYENATISQITAEARVSRGLISYYFAAKSDLLEAILGRWLDGVLGIFDVVESLGVGAGGGRSGADVRLAGVIDLVLSAAHQDLGNQRLMLCLMLQPGTREVYAKVEHDRAERVRGFEETARALFAERGAADPAVEEVLLRSALEGVLYKFAVYEGSYPLEAMRARLYEIYDLGEPAPLGLPASSGGDELRLRMTS